MSTIWFPVPVATLFRRLVNVISTASIAHHYLLPSKSSPASDDFPLELDLDPRSVSRLLWENALPAPPRTTRAADDLDGILKGARERTHITLSFSSPHARHSILWSIINTVASVAPTPISLPSIIQVRATARRASKNGRRRRT